MNKLHALAATAIVTATLSGCSAGPGYKDLPLPGSGVRGDTYELDAVFDEALNLSQGAQVKVNGLPVGRVQSVTAKDYRAVAHMEIEADQPLRKGSTARLRYDTPLGELFVQIDPADSGPELADGDSLGLEETSTAPSVEDTLASASLLVNGGGLGQIQTIAEELNTALGGREDVVRRAFERSSAVLADVNASKNDINRLLVSLRDASKVLDQRRATIEAALDKIGPTAEVLRDETDELVGLLQGAHRLTGNANKVMDSSRKELLVLLRELYPILDELLSTRPVMAQSLSDLISGSGELQRTMPGDFPPLNPHVPVERLVPGQGSPIPLPDLPGLPGIDLPGLPALPAVPLPDLPPILLPGLPPIDIL